MDHRDAAVPIGSRSGQLTSQADRLSLASSPPPRDDALTITTAAGARPSRYTSTPTFVSTSTPITARASAPPGGHHSVHVELELELWSSSWVARPSLEYLPNEVLLHVLDFLDVYDLLATSRVSHSTDPYSPHHISKPMY